MANIDRWFLRIAVIYALVAMFLGITMGIREDFTQASTHAHLNLVGWVSMALMIWSIANTPRRPKVGLQCYIFGSPMSALCY